MITWMLSSPCSAIQSQLPGCCSWQPCFPADISARTRKELVHFRRGLMHVFGNLCHKKKKKKAQNYPHCLIHFEWQIRMVLRCRQYFESRPSMDLSILTCDVWFLKALALLLVPCDRDGLFVLSVGGIVAVCITFLAFSFRQADRTHSLPRAGVGVCMEIHKVSHKADTDKTASTYLCVSAEITVRKWQYWLLFQFCWATP